MNVVLNINFKDSLVYFSFSSYLSLAQVSRAVLMNKNILTSCLNVSNDLISTYFPSDFNRLGYVWGKMIFKIAFQLIFRKLSLTNRYDGKSLCFISFEGIFPIG